MLKIDRKKGNLLLLYERGTSSFFCYQLITLFFVFFLPHTQSIKTSVLKLNKNNDKKNNEVLMNVFLFCYRFV